MKRWAFLIAAAPLAACGSPDAGTSVTINAGSDAASIKGDLTKGGTATIDVPGFKGSIQLPKLQLDADNFEMNGVHLFPGSTIGGVNVNSDNKEGVVNVSFDSPGSVTAVRDWYRDKLQAAGFKLTQDGNGLTGITDEGKPFRMTLDAAGTDKAKGNIAIGG